MLWGPRYTPWQKLELPFYPKRIGLGNLSTHLQGAFGFFGRHVGSSFAVSFLFFFFLSRQWRKKTRRPKFPEVPLDQQGMGKSQKDDMGVKKWSPTSSYTFGIFLVGSRSCLESKSI
jgi:hypothetical protein